MEKIKKTRKPRISEEERKESNDMKKIRIRIANMVARKPEIEKKCCICGKEKAPILHNKINPYMITFICRECRENENNIKVAESKRIDIRAYMDKSKLSSKSFLESDVKRIVETYLSPRTILSIGAYCKEIGISRHQFNQLVERYSVIYNDSDIKKKIIQHSNAVNNNKLSEIASRKN